VQSFPIEGRGPSLGEPLHGRIGPWESKIASLNGSGNPQLGAGRILTPTVVHFDRNPASGPFLVPSPNRSSLLVLVWISLNQLVTFPLHGRLIV